MAWIRQIKGNWYVYHRVGGREQKPVPAGKSYANAALIRREIEEKEKLGIAPQKITVNQLWTEYLTYSIQTKAPATVDHIKDHLKGFVLDHSEEHIGDLTKTTFLDYKSKLLAKYSISGVNIKLTAVKAMFQYAYAERDWLPRNPAAFVKKETPNKVGRALSKEELSSILTDGKPSEELKDLILFALYTTLRKGEILSLKKENILNDFAHIVKMRKGRKLEKFIPIPPVVQHIVKRVKSGQIFTGWNEWRLDHAWQRLIARTKKAGILKWNVRFYDLRHTGATWALTEQKMPLSTLSEIMGHSSIRQTKDTYGHLDKSHLMEAVESQDYKLP